LSERPGEVPRGSRSGAADKKRPTKVAVLGGGVGAMVAAFELTRPEHRGRFEVTVYQPGWRLGGKGASGRNAQQSMRIEEHGLHVWFGFYENAFAVMRDCYRELLAIRDRDGGDPGPLRTVWDAFKPCDDIIAFDRQGSGWTPLHVHVPPNAGHPGDGAAPKTVWELAEMLVERQLVFWLKSFARLVWREFWRISLWRDVLGAVRGGARLLDRLLGEVVEELGVGPRRRDRLAGAHALRVAHMLARDRSRARHAPARPVGLELRLLADVMIGFRDLIWDCFVASRASRDPELRCFFTTFDAWTCGMIGVLEDGVLEHGFDAINDVDLAEWLSRHGATELTIGRTPAERAPMLRAIYDLAFAYEDGDINRPTAAAGTAVSDLLRLAFSHSGHFMYKMQAGMGDVVFAPLYEVLRARGVTFQFFHEVTRLRLSRSRQSIAAIEVVEQVQLRDGLPAYSPLLEVEGVRCWPNEPDWDQLAGGERLRELPGLAASFERPCNPLARPPRPLLRGSDFDEVVLGISVGGLREICPELIAASPRFAKAIQSAGTTPTQAFQVWMRKPAKKLGWRWGTNTVAGAYTEPLDTYCDMTHLIEREAWPPEAGVSSIAYFCAVLDHRDGETPEAATRRVTANARAFFDADMRALWPKALDRGGRLRAKLLAGDTADPYAAQYYRANAAGTELYVLTPAGSVDARLPSDVSGFENLVLAGDWTRNGIDGGCVEAAATSGRQAARKLTGDRVSIPGEDRAWLRGPRPYLEYGAVQTSPGPFICRDAKVLGLLLRADEAKIRALLARVLDAGSTGGWHYRPLGEHVALMICDIAAITSANAGFAGHGYVPEWQACIAIPAAAGREVLGMFVPERLVVFYPYVLVDNPISLSGGREIYGLSKSLGQFETGEEATWRQQPLRVRAYGGDFGPSRRPGWRELIALTPSGAPTAPSAPWTHPGQFVDWLLRTAGHELASDVALPLFTLAAAVIDVLRLGRTSFAALKQFRDVSDSTRAAYHHLVEAPMEITSFAGRISSLEWDVRLHAMDSHPVLTELGLHDQHVSLAAELEMDFTLGDGMLR
jgi:uncharacterized protein with NAD-binding domain and iron-sulfur cluster